MAIIRWRPERDLWSFRDDMNELFDSFFGKSTEQREGMWSPAIDVAETKDDIIVTAEVPGLNKDDINISIQENVLTLRGEKKQSKEQKDENLHRVERIYGSFQRSFTLPTLVDFTKVSAAYKDGVLRIVLPKKEEVKPKEISISIE